MKIELSITAIDSIQKYRINYPAASGRDINCRCEFIRTRIYQRALNHFVRMNYSACLYAPPLRGFVQIAPGDLVEPTDYVASHGELHPQRLNFRQYLFNHTNRLALIPASKHIGVVDNVINIVKRFTHCVAFI